MDINNVLLRLAEKFPSASDFVINHEELIVISSKRVIHKELGEFSRIVEDVIYSLPRKEESNGRMTDVDTSWKVNESLRFRLNVARYDGDKFELTFRWLRDVTWKLEDYNFETRIVEDIFKRVEQKKGGLFLVIGPTGSGKSTVMATILNSLLSRLPVRVITIEDPVEYRLNEGSGSVIQREVGVDTPSFARALKSALRQNPNIIFVGEIRDRETVRLLLEASDTGHVVFATMHTDTPKDTMDRLMGMVDSADQQFVLTSIQKVLVGVLGLRMYDYNGKKLMLYEYMNGLDPAIKSLILQRKFESIPVFMNPDNGHVPFEYTLAKRIKEGVVDVKDMDQFGFDRQKIQIYMSKIKI